jgi:uncharacterized SAM-binding protein YcdF (DUF218 family)
MYLFPAIVLLCMWRLAYGREGRRARWIDCGAAAGLLLISWPPAAWLALATLERTSATATSPARDADAIVVLAGGLYPANPLQPEAEPGLNTYLRTQHAAWLFRHWKPLPVVVSGGKGERGRPAVAEVMRRQLVAVGVPEAAIQMEDRSTTTHENAVGTARLLLPKGARRIALVTDAYHMARAERSFRKQGFDVAPAACCFRTMEERRLPQFLLPSASAIRMNEDAIHEWIGLVWYRVRGRI